MKSIFGKKYAVWVALAVLSSIFLFSCAEDNSSDDIETDIETNIEPLLSIDQGVYGQTTMFDDVCSNESGCTIQYFPGFTFEVFDENPSSDSVAEIEPFATVVSGEQGFYQIFLEPGTYFFCTNFKRCISINVVENELLRIDYEFSNGPGWIFPLGTENIDTTSSENNGVEEIKTLIINSSLVDCVGEALQKCMQVKENETDDWQYFYDNIEGFDYEEGYVYEIVVKVTDIEDPPADGSSKAYSLGKIISKEAI